MTLYLVAAYDFGVHMDFGMDVHLAFVVDGAKGSTAIFFHGADTGARAPLALTLHGFVAFGGTDMGGYFRSDDSFAGSNIRFADYNSALSAAELNAHSDAYLSAVPARSTWRSPPSLGVIGLAARHCRRRNKKRGRRPPASGGGEPDEHINGRRGRLAGPVGTSFRPSIVNEPQPVTPVLLRRRSSPTASGAAIHHRQCCARRSGMPKHLRRCFYPLAVRLPK